MPAVPRPERIAIIGAGVAGRAFALRCVQAGFTVVLEDVMPEKLRRAQDTFEKLAERSGHGLLRLATEVEDAVRDADLTIDFVPDELESKLEIFSLLDRMAPPRTILLTPTTALSVTDLASCTYRPELCLGLRGDLGGTNITLVRGRQSGDRTLGDVQDVLERCGLRTDVIEDQVETTLIRNIP